MATIADASLTDADRRALDQLVERLVTELGPRLKSVWMYGSRARAEPPHEGSDIDLLVVVDPLDPEDEERVSRSKWDAVEAVGGVSGLISIFVYSPERLTERREIRSFFIQEVDRDKIVLFGQP